MRISVGLTPGLLARRETREGIPAEWLTERGMAGFDPQPSTRRPGTSVLVNAVNHFGAE
jgi:hypothetical protein